jgi:predicted phosphoribosyltransferase
MHLAISFGDRREAGRLLASKLSAYAGRPDAKIALLEALELRQNQSMQITAAK